MATTSPEPLRVAVCGIFGRVGTTVANAVAREDDLTLAGGVDIIAADDGFSHRYRPDSSYRHRHAGNVGAS